MRKTIKKDTFEFLNQLKKNNNKIWFDQHKDIYLKAKENIIEFSEEIKQALNQTDILEKTHLYRIYRDIRFSKDKTP